MASILLSIILINSFILNFSCAKQIYTEGHPFSDLDTENVHGAGNKVQERMSITFPGTKWCGPGDTANGYDDLGKFRETDMCCRDHDHCENIAAGQEKHGLKNNDWFTVLHCNCDKAFFNCLHATNHSVSDLIGRQYFLFRNRCYKEEYPIVECVQEQKLVLIRRCIRYRYDTSQSKIYQWFDLPLYDIESYPDSTEDDIETFYRNQAAIQNELLSMDAANSDAINVFDRY